MYADEEEDKVSAKDRIFSSIKRRVANKPQIEVYEEDVEDEAFDEQVEEGEEQVDMRQRLNFKVQSITDYLLTFDDKWMPSFQWPLGGPPTQTFLFVSRIFITLLLYQSKP